MHTKIPNTGTIDPFTGFNFLIFIYFNDRLILRGFKTSNFIVWRAWDGYGNIFIHYFLLAIWIIRSFTSLYILEVLEHNDISKMGSRVIAQRNWTKCWTCYFCRFSRILTRHWCCNDDAINFSYRVLSLFDCSIA